MHARREGDAHAQMAPSAGRGPGDRDPRDPTLVRLLTALIAVGGLVDVGLAMALDTGEP